MNKRQARKTALDWLYWVCDDPEAFFSLNDWLPVEDDYETERDRMLDAFYDLRREFARRTGRAKDAE